VRVLKAFFMCLGMFTALPCPWRPWDEEARSLMTACLPLVGLVIGVLWYTFALLGRLLLPQSLLAVLIAALPLLLTGFMHLDGFMDTSDAMLSWRPLEKRIQILKDVHCGSFSVVAVVLLILSMYAAACDASGGDLRILILIPTVSRCLSAFYVSAFKPIGHSEYAAMKHGIATPLTALLILLFTLLCGSLWLGLNSIACLIAVILGYCAAMHWCMHTLKGVSGDLAGFSLCVGELCGLIALAAIR